mgnify:CR=1 FL=1
MSQDNASFTFLHRIEEVELNIEDGRWQSALALALTLPDICGGIAFPEIVKRYRDGRAVLDRKQRPTRDVGLIHTQHLSLKSLRKISRPISAENDAGSFDVNTCTRTKALQILRTIPRFVFTWV